MPSITVLNVTVNTAESRQRIERVIALGRRYRLMRWALSHEVVVRATVWWCARPALARRNWSVG